MLRRSRDPALQGINDNLIDKLKKIAQKSPVNNRHSAVLFKNDNFYNFSYNTFVKQDTTVHAEINAIKTFYERKVKGLHILVIRVNKSGIIRNSRPCNECIKKLLKLGIQKIFYSNDFGNITWEYTCNMTFKHISSASRRKI